MNFKKISKAQAKKLYLNFKPFIMAASKVNPASIFAARIDEHVNRDFTTDADFEALVNEFRYYNCGYPETGRGVAFYVEVA